MLRVLSFLSVVRQTRRSPVAMSEMQSSHSSISCSCSTSKYIVTPPVDTLNVFELCSKARPKATWLFFVFKSDSSLIGATTAIDTGSKEKSFSWISKIFREPSLKLITTKRCFQRETLESFQTPTLNVPERFSTLLPVSDTFTCQMPRE